MFLVHIHVEQSDLSTRYHPQHIEFLNTQYENNIFLIFGRNLTRESSGLIVAQALNKAELIKVLEQDPYIQYGCANFEIEEFSPAKINASIAQFE